MAAVVSMNDALGAYRPCIRTVVAEVGDFLIGMNGAEFYMAQLVIWRFGHVTLVGGLGSSLGVSLTLMWVLAMAKPGVCHLVRVIGRTTQPFLL